MKNYYEQEPDDAFLQIIETGALCCIDNYVGLLDGFTTDLEFTFSTEAHPGSGSIRVFEPHYKDQYTVNRVHTLISIYDLKVSPK